MEKEKLRQIMADPVLWAKAFIISNDAQTKKMGPWIARNYQEEMLRDKSYRKVYRCGRRCLTKDAVVPDPFTGELLTVKELYEKTSVSVCALNQDTYEITEQTSCPVSYNGIKQTYKITLDGWKDIVATDNHPFLTPDEWKELGQLKPGDFIAIPSYLHISGDKVIQLPHLRNLLYAMLDMNNDAFSRVDPEYIRREEQKKMGVRDKSGPRIAPDIFRLKTDEIIEFLRLFTEQVTFDSTGWQLLETKELAGDIAHLLLRLGIRTFMKAHEDGKCSLKFMDHISRAQFYFMVLDKRDIDDKDPIEEFDEFPAIPYGSDIQWRKIKSISYESVQDTYDLHVPVYNNFVANDIITHNTGKSETMIVEGLHMAWTHKLFRILFITPYENQVNLIFRRMKEIIHNSPLIKNEVVRMTNSPYTLEFKNGSTIMGFTTGASSGSGAASVRGQRADWIFLDELDYMGNEDYATISMIAGERRDIGMTCSSTPTGARREFYKMCTDPNSEYSQHYHPSMDNPNWCQEMEDGYRRELTPVQYEHEILANFGSEESGVFPKDKVDVARNYEYYAYSPLDSIQLRNLSGQPLPHMLIYDESNPAPPNPFRCIGVDFDKFQASSSIVVLDFDVNLKKFKVINRIEVPRSEYTLDNAVKWIIKVNNIYNPSWIFCDRGYGDYQLERLHIYGDSHPTSGLKNKVIGYQFKESLDIIDPITKETKKEPLKQFMVSQLCLSFERERIALSPFDETLHKQLIDYCVDHIGANKMPVYTSKNEHFVDALGLAHLAFVLKFPNLTGAIKPVENSSIIEHSSRLLGMSRASSDLREISDVANPWSNNIMKRTGFSPGERKGDYQQWIKVPLNKGISGTSRASWGRRGGNNSFGRSMW